MVILFELKLFTKFKFIKSSTIKWLTELVYISVKLRPLIPISISGKVSYLYYVVINKFLYNTTLPQTSSILVMLNILTTLLYLDKYVDNQNLG